MPYEIVCPLDKGGERVKTTSADIIERIFAELVKPYSPPTFAVPGR